MIPPEPFSEREKDVAALLLQGKGNKQIAQELGVTTRTVEFHLSHIYQKLGVSSRTEALIKLTQDPLRETTGGSEGANLRESTVDNLPEPSENIENDIPETRRFTMRKPLPYFLILVVFLCLVLFVCILVYNFQIPG